MERVTVLDQVGQSPNGNDVVAEALASAKKTAELRDAAITHLLAQREQIERDLKMLGYSAPIVSRNGSEIKPAVPVGSIDGRKRFTDLTLAEIGRILLQESGPLHGKEIERRAKAGGFKGGTKSFQNYMPVAFKRAGGFQNTGGNNWRLNEEIAPVR
jgi:hypothetical protein